MTHCLLLAHNSIVFWNRTCLRRSVLRYSSCQRTVNDKTSIDRSMWWNPSISNYEDAKAIWRCSTPSSCVHGLSLHFHLFLDRHRYQNAHPHDVLPLHYHHQVISIFPIIDPWSSPLTQEIEISQRIDYESMSNYWSAQY